MRFDAALFESASLICKLLLTIAEVFVHKQNNRLTSRGGN